LRSAAVVAAAFVFAAPASAWTDGGRGLSLQWPASGTVTRGFGHPDGDEHNGIDIGTLRSLDILAAGAGIVVATGYPAGYEGYGEVVIVDLGAGFSAIYAHLSHAGVRVGQVVWPGAKLGIAGCTGWCTGTHLHFEVREDGTAFDPAPLLPATIP
jgi:murein DD-endopeptidase MepM/ murein hydrolase activator NlpD